jgi:hypothetical protein
MAFMEKTTKRSYGACSRAAGPFHLQNFGKFCKEWQPTAAKSQKAYKTYDSETIMPELVTTMLIFLEAKAC